MGIFGPRATPRRVLGDSDGEGRATTFAAQQGWDEIGREHADVDRGIDDEVTWLTSENATFHFGRDSMSGVDYVFVATDDRELADRLDAAVREALPTLSFDVLVADAAGQPDPSPARARALLKAAIASPFDVDDQLASLLRAAMHSAEPAMRRTAIVATSFTEWREMFPLLQAAAKTNDRVTRALAKAAVRAFREHGLDRPPVVEEEEPPPA